MVFLFFLALNITAIVFFLKKRTRLHVLETMLYWLVSSYLFQNLSALCYMNFHTLGIPERFSSSFSHVLNRLVIYPLIMVTFLHYYAGFYSIARKLGLIIGFMLILLGMEWLGDATGVLVHVHWQLWWSFAYWFTTLLALIGVMKLFRKILYRKRVEL
jgi:membrane-bound ClpP family serine protease